MTLIRRLTLLAGAMLALGGVRAYAEHYDAKVRVRTLLEATENASGQKLAMPANAEVHAVEVTIPAGVHTGWHRHPYAGFAYVLAGELEVEERGGAKRRYKAGQAMAEVIGEDHDGHPVGSAPVKLVAFFFTSPGQPFSEKTP
jgi:quercetin dioxygenase-like cupin family protein